MNRFFKYSCILVVAAVGLFACEQEKTYPGGVLSDYIAMLDLRQIYKDKDVVLTRENMAGATQIAGVVVSDHRGGNLPAGLLMVQDFRRLNMIRGISIQLGNAAGDYVPGDSIEVSVVGKKLTKVDGILQLEGVQVSDIKKIASNKPIPVNRVNSNLYLKFPDRYESVLSVIVKGSFNPLSKPGDQFGGDWIVTDAFENIKLHTEANAEFADSTLPMMANYYGIFLNMVKDGKPDPQFRMRRSSDFVRQMAATEAQPILITGFVSDVSGGDGNYEYIQLMATRDIDFTVTPFSFVINNNAGTAQPIGVPALGWATGNQRTYKININTGSAKKGTFFYVGGANKLINGPSSTNISAANWVRNYDYVNKDGEGFGVKKNGWMANSGNAFGLAIFEGTTVTEASAPIDVMWVSSGGSLFAGNAGYRVGNTDWYDINNPVTLAPQPFYRAGTNTTFLSYNPEDQGFFYILGGEYNLALRRWTKARSQTNWLMTKSSTLSELESDSLSTKLKEQ
ncbi:DUF5689 domain-containing protein [Chitinophaga horti]|uniref:DUF5689 domain-containing protein n=1 Tax=Chitinophaga horti TaxID=2920382 RepID=A0ABY6J857_9BACT|nr:DUF5689 domain-containing protein [Chitinophaga horti]UYQ94487.1 DUF5689 domain-containing protein [Chitinophaga horti]